VLAGALAADVAQASGPTDRPAAAHPAASGDHLHPNDAGAAAPAAAVPLRLFR
jgi:hypothetical protein